MLRHIFVLASILIAADLCLPAPQEPKSEDVKVDCGPILLIYLPVCGSDGKTYANEGVLRCHNLQEEANNRQVVTVVKNGKCENSEPTQ